MAEDHVGAALFADVAVFLGLWSILSLHTDVISWVHRRVMFMHLPDPVKDDGK